MISDVRGIQGGRKKKEETLLIEVRNLVKRYGDNVAVDHLNFTVQEGRITGFLGPNGAGKSTTMNMITGYLAPNEGTVVIDGHDIMEEPEEAKRCIGVSSGASAPVSGDDGAGISGFCVRTEKYSESTQSGGGGQSSGGSADRGYGAPADPKSVQRLLPESGTGTGHSRKP